LFQMVVRTIKHISSNRNQELWSTVLLLFGNAGAASRNTRRVTEEAYLYYPLVS
jgi:hypothetical protein